jgi:TIGR03009 family protein
MLPAPFTLTPHEQRNVDWVLAKWEEQSAGVKTFQCRFRRFEIDPVFGEGNQPQEDEGEIRYAAPDKGLFHVFQPEGVRQPREEYWICDGKSVFKYDYLKRQVLEHKLPPELHGKAITNGPLPFLFGAKADQLKSRYYLRLVKPSWAENPEDYAELEAYPRHQADAANFRSAALVLTLPDMQPFALRMIEPNGREVRYRFYNLKINAKNLLDPLGLFENNWVNPSVPSGWTRTVARPPGAPSGRPTPGGFRR